jgi:hypothetical protein
MHIFKKTPAALVGLILFLGFICTPLPAKELTVATITNDDNPNVVKFIVDLNDQSGGIDHFTKETYLNSELILKESFSPRDLEGDGIALEIRGGQVILALKSENFSQTYGGDLVIDTLYNVTLLERKNYYIEISHKPDGWKLLLNGTKISQMYIQSNRLPILGVVGIKNILMK